MKNVMVLFSGGLDSTYLVWKNLMDGNNVFPVYIDIKNNRQKTLIENQQSEKIIEILNDVAKTLDLKRMALNTVVTIEVHSTVSDELHLLQLPIWITGMMYSGKLSLVDEIHVGYVMNDDAISYPDDMKNLYESYKPFMYHHPKLMFPLIKEKKTSIYHNLPENVRTHIISCECPILIGQDNKEIHSPSNIKEISAYKTCGECASCKRQKEQGIYDFDKDFNETFAESKVSEKAKHFLLTKAKPTKTVGKVATKSSKKSLTKH